MPEPKSKNISWSESAVTRQDRERVHGHRSVILWLTGLSGSGKSSIAHLVEQRLTERNLVAYVLDGDNIRHGVSSDLGFSPEDRMENIRRVGEVARLFVDSGAIVVCAFISPLRIQRQRVRDLVGKDDFVEVYVRASLATCEKRDPKGLYRKARNGQIPDFTGIDAPYEPPERAEVTVDTETETLEESARHVMDYLESAAYVTR